MLVAHVASSTSRMDLLVFGFPSYNLKPKFGVCSGFPTTPISQVFVFVSLLPFPDPRLRVSAASTEPRSAWACATCGGLVPREPRETKQKAESRKAKGNHRKPRDPS